MAKILIAEDERDIRDLIEFTLLKAYLNADRLGEANHLLATRRPGPTGIPIAGLALHKEFTA